MIQNVCNEDYNKIQHKSSNFEITLTWYSSCCHVSETSLEIFGRHIQIASLMAVQCNTKTKENLINLCHHKKDFKIPAERHFFATSHSKSPCDGVGGTCLLYTSRCV